MCDDGSKRSQRNWKILNTWWIKSWIQNKRQGNCRRIKSRPSKKIHSKGFSRNWPTSTRSLKIQRLRTPTKKVLFASKQTVVKKKKKRSNWANDHGHISENHATFSRGASGRSFERSGQKALLLQETAAPCMPAPSPEQFPVARGGRRQLRWQTWPLCRPLFTWGFVS